MAHCGRFSKSAQHKNWHHHLITSCNLLFDVFMGVISIFTFLHFCLIVFLLLYLLIVIVSLNNPFIWMMLNCVQGEVIVWVNFTVNSNLLHVLVSIVVILIILIWLIVFVLLYSKLNSPVLFYSWSLFLP